jgi:hypothetical protein
MKAIIIISALASFDFLSNEVIHAYPVILILALYALSLLDFSILPIYREINKRKNREVANGRY